MIRCLTRLEGVSCMTANVRSVFWDDLDEDLKDPELRHHYLLESARIAAIDSVINQLDDLRTGLNMTKADLARAIERTPETVRRLLTSRSVNPQFAVVVEMAAAMGYQVTLSPMSAQDRKDVAEPLRELVASPTTAPVRKDAPSRELVGV